MCAITGLVLDHSKPRSQQFLAKVKDLFTDSLASTVYGGYSATGVMILNKGFKIHWGKNGIRSPLFVESEQYKQLLNQINEETVAIVGHCRAATVGGEEKNINNHPHQCGSSIGVHHGHVRDHVEVAKKFAIPLKGQCDSELLVAAFDVLTHRFKWQPKRVCNFIQKNIKANYAVALFNKNVGDKLVLFREKQKLEVHTVRMDDSLLTVINSRFSETDRVSKKYDLEDRNYITEFSGRSNRLALISSPSEMEFASID